jgi:hypothetical protein
VLQALADALAEGRTQLDQVLAVLAACGHRDPAGLPVGRGDRALLAACAELTGRPVEVVVPCPRCGTVNEVRLGPDDVPPPEERCAVLDGGGVREPTYGDLRDLPDDDAAAAEALLSRCLVGAPRRAAGASDLVEVDASLTGPLRLACAGCGAAVDGDVDVPGQVLRAVDQHCAEVDWETHVLASAYHWDLASITALTAERRRRLVGYALSSGPA